MATQRVMLIDERDNRLGTCDVSPACQAIEHDDALFLRTSETVRIAGRAQFSAIVFRYAEPWKRAKLTPV